MEVDRISMEDRRFCGEEGDSTIEESETVTSSARGGGEGEERCMRGERRAEGG